MPPPQPLQPEAFRRVHIRKFFAKYPVFRYDSNQPIMVQFYTMCALLQWNADDPEREDAIVGLHGAVANTFDMIYGTDVDDLSAWQKLHMSLYDGPAPRTLQDCRDVSCLSLHSLFCLYGQVKSPPV